MTYTNMINALFPEGAPNDFKAYALILPEHTVTAMQSIQQALQSNKHRVSPVPTTDGRWLVSADILPEFDEAGLFKRATPHLDASIFTGIQVVQWQDGLALLPEPDSEISEANV